MVLAWVAGKVMFAVDMTFEKRKTPYFRQGRINLKVHFLDITIL